MSNKKPTVIRGHKTFPKEYDGLVIEAIALMSKHYARLPLDDNVVVMEDYGRVCESDAAVVITILEDEFGVYVKKFDASVAPYTIRDIIDDLAEKIGIKKNNKRKEDAKNIKE